jgi:hypothetical protein
MSAEVFRKLILFSIILIVVYYTIYYTNKSTTIKLIFNKKHKIKIINLGQPLIPEELYDSIECRKSAVFIVSTLLCVHDKENDMHVSGQIINNGAWEAHILSPFTRYIKDNPDWLVLDVGAQIGIYFKFFYSLIRLKL